MCQTHHASPLSCPSEICTLTGWVFSMMDLMSLIVASCGNFQTWPDLCAIGCCHYYSVTDAHCDCDCRERETERVRVSRSPSVSVLDGIRRGCVSDSVRKGSCPCEWWPGSSRHLSTSLEWTGYDQGSEAAGKIKGSDMLCKHVCAFICSSQLCYSSIIKCLL